MRDTIVRRTKRNSIVNNEFLEILLLKATGKRPKSNYDFEKALKSFRGMERP